MWQLQLMYLVHGYHTNYGNHVCDTYFGRYAVLCPLKTAMWDPNLVWNRNLSTAFSAEIQIFFNSYNCQCLYMIFNNKKNSNITFIKQYIETCIWIKQKYK